METPKITMRSLSSIENLPGTSNVSKKSTELQLHSSAPSQSPLKSIGVKNANKRIFDGAMDETYEEFAKAEDFEIMVDDLRRSFIGWLKKVETRLRRERDHVNSLINSFEAEKERMWERLMEEEKLEMETVKDERFQFELDMERQLNQIKWEASEIHGRIAEEHEKCELERRQARSKMVVEAERLQQEFETVERERSQIVDPTIAKATIININVGGTLFETSRSTISQQKGSLLDEMCSGRHTCCKDRSGNIFLDRDPNAFRSLLNFLRNPTCLPIPRTLVDTWNVYKEADFLQVKLMPNALQYILGGHDGNAYLRSCEIFNCETGDFIAAKAMETERTYHGSARIGPFIFCCGGQNASYRALADVEMLDVFRDQWLCVPPLFYPRRNHSTIAVEKTVYAIGGFDGTNILKNMECYDFRMRNWMKCAELPTPKSGASVSLQDGRIILVGGTDGKRVNTVEEYDCKMNRWESLPNLTGSRSAAASHSFLRHIFCFGGVDDQNEVLSSVEMLSPSEKTWEIITHMDVPRMDFSVSAFDDYTLMIIGGVNKSQILDSCAFYKPDLNSWEQGPNMLSPRCGHTALVLTI